MKIKNPRIRAGIDPKPTIALGKWQYGPSPGTRATDVTKPYTCIRFGAMDVTKPFEFIGFGAMDVTKSYKFIRLGAMDVTTPHKLKRFGAMGVTKPYQIYKVWGHGCHQAL